MSESLAEIQATGDQTPYRGIDLPEVRLDCEQRANGSLLLRNRDPLPAPAGNLVERVFHFARQAPNTTMIAQRDKASGDWIKLSYGDAKRHIEAIAQWFFNRGQTQNERLLILSGNSIAHAMLKWGAMAAGVVSCPVSSNYALMGGDYQRLKHVIELIKPTVIFAETAEPYRRIFRELNLLPEANSGNATPLIISTEAQVISTEAVAYQSLLATPIDANTASRITQLSPDTPAFYMLTSGSSGVPKAVIQTHRMHNTNMQQAQYLFALVMAPGKNVLDWLPWSHVSGMSMLFLAALHGMAFYIDEGKPMPALFKETLRNLREIPVPSFCNVPNGYAMLVEALEADAELRKTFFSELRLLIYGGAALAQPVYDRLQAMAIAETGQRIFLTSGYGLTETAAGCMSIFFDSNKVGIGLPLPGLDLKLVPLATADQSERFEVRISGDNISPGYLDLPDATKAAFDEEGYFKTGDTARFHNPDNYREGLAFAGRLSDEFKLGTGTWVLAGLLRVRFLEALSPALTDVIVCGNGRNCLAVLGVANPKGLQKIADSDSQELPTLYKNTRVIDFLRKAITQYNRNNPGSSTAIYRFAFTRQMPSAARYEISDKGSINQALAAENREHEVEQLYSESPPEAVLVFDNEIGGH